MPLVKLEDFDPITVNLLTVMTLRGMNVYTQATNEKIGTISDAL